MIELPDQTAVWPTHGAGSFCSAPPGTKRISTIGEQKKANPLLTVPDEAAFIRNLLASLGSYPTYFDRLAEVNRRGPAVVMTDPLLPALDPGAVKAVIADGGYVVDVRPATDYAAGHIHGAVSIPLRDQFATWLGWLLPDTAPLVFVTSDNQDLRDVVWQAYGAGTVHSAGLVWLLIAWDRPNGYESQWSAG